MLVKFLANFLHGDDGDVFDSDMKFVSELV